MVGGAIAAHVNFQIAARVCVQTNNLLRLTENDVLEKLQVLTLGGLSVMQGRGTGSQAGRVGE